MIHSLGCCLGSSKIFLWIGGGVVCQSYVSFCCLIQTVSSPDMVIESWSPCWHCFMWYISFVRSEGCFSGIDCTASQYWSFSSLLFRIPYTRPLEIGDRRTKDSMSFGDRCKFLSFSALPLDLKNIRSIFSLIHKFINSNKFLDSCL